MPEREDYIDEVFGARGLLSARFDNYCVRAGQIAMAREVDLAFREGGHLLVEAPTGTGKSLAYAVPAAYNAVLGSRTVIATANIALQEQLILKDLPFLQEVLPYDFSFAIAKGRSNYLCRRRCAGNLERLHRKPPKKWTKQDRDQFAAIHDWHGTTATGDRSELDFEPDGRLWSLVSSGTDACTRGGAEGDKRGCGYEVECYTQTARAAMQDANIVVCNYHLLFAHATIAASSGGRGRVLPEFAAVVMDEAHRAPEIARDFLGFSIGQGWAHWHGAMLHAIGAAGTYAALETRFRRFFADLRRYWARRRGDGRIVVADAVPWKDLVEMIREVGAELTHGARRAMRDGTTDPQEVRIHAKACRTAAAQIEAALGLTDREWVSYVDVSGSEDGEKETIKLASKPVRVGGRLREILFGEVRTSVLTSATLTAGGSFSFMTREMGVPLPCRVLITPTPFDFERQTRLALIDPGVDPGTGKGDTAFPDAVARYVRYMVKIMGGRTLALFTSKRNMRITYELLMASDLPFRILMQGDMPRPKLIDEFKRDVTSVLLGVESFWAGIDVPGEALSCVVIDRMPFLPPTDPVVQALEGLGEKPFPTYTLPRAIIGLKQGFGRLIRTSTDRGVVAILDRRLTRKFYGAQIVASLPPAPVITSREELLAFVAGDPAAGQEVVP